jgi:hypothetical protein
MVQDFPRSQPGQRVRVIPLQVETLESGGLRISSPLARGWASVARNPTELARSIAAAYTEVACSSYARWKGAPYDLDAMTTHVPGDPLADTPQRRVRTGRTTRVKQYAVEAWTKFDNGQWRSPSGRMYREDTMAVQNVIKKRKEKGLPT